MHLVISLILKTLSVTMTTLKQSTGCELLKSIHSLFWCCPSSWDPSAFSFSSRFRQLQFLVSTSLCHLLIPPSHLIYLLFFVSVANFATIILAPSYKSLFINCKTWSPSTTPLLYYLLALPTRKRPIYHCSLSCQHEYLLTMTMLSPHNCKECIIHWI